MATNKQKKHAGRIARKAYTSADRKAARKAPGIVSVTPHEGRREHMTVEQYLGRQVYRKALSTVTKKKRKKDKKTSIIRP